MPSSDDKQHLRQRWTGCALCTCPGILPPSVSTATDVLTEKFISRIPLISSRRLLLILLRLQHLLLLLPLLMLLLLLLLVSSGPLLVVTVPVELGTTPSSC